MGRVWRGGLWVLTAGALAALLGGFAGALHPLGDSLAVFRLHAGLSLTLLSLALTLSGAGRTALVPGLAALLAVPAALSYLPGNRAAPADGFILYQKNLNFLTGDLGAIARDIRDSGAEIVMLQEVSPRNVAIIEALRADYPTAAFCPFTARVGGTMVLSRWAGAGDPRCTSGMTALELEGPGGRLWAVSVHLHWPWPFDQAAQARTVAAAVADLGGRVVVAGDFNMVPWGHSVGQVASAAGARVVGPTTPTLALEPGLAMLPIDHVLLPVGWSGGKELRPELGSDHRGVVVRVSRGG